MTCEPKCATTINIACRLLLRADANLCDRNISTEESIYFSTIFFLLLLRKKIRYFSKSYCRIVSSLILLNSINCQEIVWLGYKTLDVHTEVHRNTADPGGNAWRAEMMQWVSSSSSTTLSPSRIHYTYGCFSRASARA